jgi:hypothetical protein
MNKYFKLSIVILSIGFIADFSTSCCRSVGFEMNPFANYFLNYGIVGFLILNIITFSLLVGICKSSFKYMSYKIAPSMLIFIGLLKLFISLGNISIVPNEINQWLGNIIY